MRDTAKRSVLKAISWRVVGTLDTLVLSLLIFQNEKAAVPFLIAGTEVSTKILLYFLHERGWNLVPWGRGQGRPSHVRSVIKGITWRILGTLDTMMIAFFYTGNINGAVKLGLTEVATKITLFYFHERLWSMVGWGRVYAPMHFTEKQSEKLIAEVPLEKIKKAVRGAGEEILSVYHSGVDFASITDKKADDSPLTLADQKAHVFLEAALKELTPQLPLLSEEGADIPQHKRQLWKAFWCLDPLDGTKEFLSRNGEFTVNLALIHGERPVLGLLYIPTEGLLYVGGVGQRAYREGQDGVLTPIQVSGKTTQRTAVRSRSHAEPAEEQMLSDLNVVNTISAGSALKFARVAEGAADVYLRLGPTMEWDTAAGHAIVEAAGGKVVTPEGKPFVYNKPVLRNGSFRAQGYK